MRSDRRYRFEVSREELWRRIGDVDAYRGWWPWLRGFEAGALQPGDRWACTVQPPLPYVLRFTVELHEVVAPALVVATVVGDILGEARLELTEAGPGCEARLVSDLAPGNRALATVARVARPLVRFGHDWVLDTGARQFARRAI